MSLRSLIAGVIPTEAKARKSGFTLLELLVVVALIALLAALLSPALLNAKEVGRLSRCKSNLRQLSLAMEMYVSDQGRYPYYLMVVGSPTSFVSWDGALFLYTQSRWTNNLYQCPSYRYQARPTAYDPSTHAWIAPEGSYGYNWIGTGELAASSGASVLHLGLGGMALQAGGAVEGTRKESEVLVPSDMAELGDGGGGQISPPFSVAPSYNRFTHRKLLNVAFCDGHVETPQGFRFYQPTEAARRRFNFDHDPHVETWEDNRDEQPFRPEFPVTAPNRESDGPLDDRRSDR